MSAEPLTSLVPVSVREAITFRADRALRAAIEAAAARDGEKMSKWIVKKLRAALAEGNVK